MRSGDMAGWGDPASRWYLARFSPDLSDYFLSSPSPSSSLGPLMAMAVPDRLISPELVVFLARPVSTTF